MQVHEALHQRLAELAVDDQGGGGTQQGEALLEQRQWVKARSDDQTAVKKRNGTTYNIYISFILPNINYCNTCALVYWLAKAIYITNKCSTAEPHRRDLHCTCESPLAARSG
jgi:hypothetical protein